MKLRIVAEAEEELRDASAWYEGRQGGLGVELLAAVDEAVRRIQQAPRQFARVEAMPDEENVRRLLLRRFPFKLVYEIGDDEIRVLAVAHMQRRPGYWKHRR